MKTLLTQETTVTELKALCRNAERVRAALALITQHGWNLLEPKIGQFLKQRGKLQLLLGTDMWTEPTAITKLLVLSERYQGQIEMRRFTTAKPGIFHPKLWIISPKAKPSVVVVGSSNVTMGGLDRNHELNVLVRNADGVARFEEYFDELFEGGRAKEIDRRWLRDYERIWKEHQAMQKRMDRLREKIRSLGPRNAAKGATPDRIRGITFAFTGAIPDNPREATLYPRVRGYGGEVVEIEGINKANCLVHGDVLSGQQTTRKLRAARSRNIPVINQTEFFEILEREKRLRRRKTGTARAD